MAGYVDDRSSCEKSVGLGHRHPKMRLSITPFLHVASGRKGGNATAVIFTSRHADVKAR